MTRLTRDGTAEPVSRDQIVRHARGQGNIMFPCSADHEQDWQPYPVGPYSAICDDHIYIQPPRVIPHTIDSQSVFNSFLFRTVVPHISPAPLLSFASRIFQGCVRYGTYRGIPPVFPPVYTLPSVSVRSVQASIPYRKFRYARYSPPYPTENLGIRRKIPRVR